MALGQSGARARALRILAEHGGGGRTLRGVAACMVAAEDGSDAGVDAALAARLGDVERRGRQDVAALEAQYRVDLKQRERRAFGDIDSESDSDSDSDGSLWGGAAMAQRAQELLIEHEAQARGNVEEAAAAAYERVAQRARAALGTLEKRAAGRRAAAVAALVSEEAANRKEVDAAHGAAYADLRDAAAVGAAAAHEAARHRAAVAEVASAEHMDRTQIAHNEGTARSEAYERYAAPLSAMYERWFAARFQALETAEAHGRSEVACEEGREGDKLVSAEVEHARTQRERQWRLRRALEFDRVVNGPARGAQTWPVPCAATELGGIPPHPSCFRPRSSLAKKLIRVRETRAKVSTTAHRGAFSTPAAAFSEYHRRMEVAKSKLAARPLPAAAAEGEVRRRTAAPRRAQQQGAECKLSFEDESTLALMNVAGV
eukprot:TRINITY_DN21120_c0_g1_i1.p1 TRINITY_DN21120_c0_g1~~TRINITY_DN21120_c0_g1_i1.p1  ORF type:complete len:431 (+),score=85.35 TRINITY_DN21120_c0_g1_i1:106-1398(+)